MSLERINSLPQLVRDCISEQLASDSLEELESSLSNSKQSLQMALLQPDPDFPFTAELCEMEIASYERRIEFLNLFNQGSDEIIEEEVKLIIEEFVDKVTFYELDSLL